MIQLSITTNRGLPDVPMIHFNTIETDMPADKEIIQYIGKPAEWFVLLKSINPGSLIFENSVLEGIRNEMTSSLMAFLPLRTCNGLKDIKR